MRSHDFDTLKCDILVVGGGGSGAIAAFEASRNQGLKIIVVSRGPISRSGLTPTGNGGTALPSSPQDMFQFMVNAGDYLNDQSLAWFMVNEIRNSIEELKRLGVPVSPLGPKAACVPGVGTLEILRRALIKQPNVDLLEDVLITSLIKTGETLSAATALDLSTGKFFVIEFAAIVLATGGVAGELYPYTSNNPFGLPSDASGMGHAMAYLAGAELMDMELVQFVPVPSNPQCRNVRYFPDFWKGPYLNRHGEVVESNPAAYAGETYSHLFVQKMFREVEAGNGPIFVDQRNQSTGGEWVLPIKSWERRRKNIKLLGIDPHENRIELAIGSHFCMGGIRVNAKTETTIPGLYAAGEVMGGVHGGLRLPGYSFAQMIVFGFEAGRRAASFAEIRPRSAGYDTADVFREAKRVFGFLESKENPLSLREAKRRLQKVMNDHVFVLREESGLQKGNHEIKALQEDALRLSVPGFKRFNLEWARAIEFSSAVLCAGIIAESALFRRESRGAHCRRDFPQKQQRPEHTVALFKEGRLGLRSLPVVLDRMRPEA
jgi:succinate dehydrogenase/fumarate reductase flavoprotein subunit